MRVRTLLRTALQIRPTSSSVPPPTFLVPWRANLHQSTHSTQFQSTPPEIPPQPSDPNLAISTSSITPPKPQLHPQPRSSKVTTSPNSQTTQPLVLSKSLQSLLPLLAAQKPHYVTTHIHRFPYLITEGDTLRLPFHMHGVAPGDILRLNRASILGSRDYTLKAGTKFAETYDGKTIGDGPNYIDERLFECRARVMGTDTGPMVVEIKTKRRQRKQKHARSKHKYTVLKVMQVRVKGLEELRGEGEDMVLQ